MANATYTGGLGNVGKSAIAVIPIQRVAMDPDNVQIFKTVIVLIADGDSHLVSAPLHPGF